MNAIDILTKARELIAEPKRWTKHRAASVSPTGPTLKPNDPNAACWCAVGACAKAVGKDLTVPKDSAWGDPEVRMAIYGLMETVTAQHGAFYSSLPDFNDSPSTTHAEILDVFDRTITRFESTK